MTEVTKSKKSKIGFIGLGEMGALMAERLIAAGHTIYGYNRTKSKAEKLITKGLIFAESPQAVTEQCNTVITIVTNNAAVEAIYQGKDGILQTDIKNKTFIDISTIAPEASMNLAKKIKSLGGEFCDAPVSGNPIMLAEGKVSFMLGGSTQSFEIAKPILEDIGKSVLHVGDNGTGLIMKLAVNLNIAVQFQGYCEGVLLAEKSGIPRETAVKVMLNSAICSPLLSTRGLFILDMPEKALFDVNMMQKDLNYALNFAREKKVPMPNTALVNEVMNQCRAMEIDHEDYAIMFKALAKNANLSEK